jgi:hypothetical protein
VFVVSLGSSALLEAVNRYQRFTLQAVLIQERLPFLRLRVLQVREELSCAKFQTSILWVLWFRAEDELLTLRVISIVAVRSLDSDKPFCMGKPVAPPDACLGKCAGN